MTNFETLCENITEYERKQLADDWSISRHSVWQGMTFTEIVGYIDRYGDSYGKAENELCNRLDDFLTFGQGVEICSLDYATKMCDGLSLIDGRLGSSLRKQWSEGKTPEEIVAEWEEQERWEREESERAELIDLCANIAYNDGLCDSLEEALDIASMVC